jgi:hypothetical protein
MFTLPFEAHVREREKTLVENRRPNVRGIPVFKMATAQGLSRSVEENETDRGDNG